MSYIDQREPGHDWQNNNPRWTERFKSSTVKTPSKYDGADYKFKNIKDYPTSRKDVLFPHVAKLNFHHRMDALKYCNDNNIPFIWWNDIMYDLEGNIIDIDYYHLPE